MSVIAVSIKDFQQFGCPYCGYEHGRLQLSTGLVAVNKCGECEKKYHILAMGIPQSEVREGEAGYPELQPHPRHGTPSHERPDAKPEGGGEFFRVRGRVAPNGSQYQGITPGCFVCGGPEEIHDVIPGFVGNKHAAKRIIAMCSPGSCSDDESFGRDQIQVTIGACRWHWPSLYKLDELVQDGVITESRIAEARAFKRD